MSDIATIASFIRKRFRRVSARALLRGMVQRADAARDAGRLSDAALIYGEALLIDPRNAGIHVQRANMLKDIGDHPEAEKHYKAALALRPKDADAAYQMGHLYKGWGRLDLAKNAYSHAAELAPDWSEPRSELERLHRAGWRGAAIDDRSAVVSLNSDLGAAARALDHAVDVQKLAPELVPSSPQRLFVEHPLGLHLRSLGRRERTHWGVANVLRGVEAIRGVVITPNPVMDVHVYLDDQLIYRGRPQGSAVLTADPINAALRKYVFNIWLDFGGFTHGRHTLEIRAADLSGKSYSQHHMIVVAAPLAEADFPASDQLVNIDTNDPRPIDEQINLRPSVTRAARRAMLEKAPGTILVMRTDQLGDMVVSLPALRVLRSMYPDARLIGLLSAANAELAATLGVFDDILIADFPDDREQGRRVMTIEKQIALREKLSAFKIDMAIDLSEVSPSRLLFNLTDAPFRYGFRHPQEPNLTLDIEGNSHDRMNYHEVVPHTNKLVGMMEWLRAMTRSEPNVARRDDLDWTHLETFGLPQGDRFAVLHDGARLPFSRWPHYAELAKLVLADTGLRLILLTDDPSMRSRLPPELAQSDRFTLIDGKMEFDQFDALMHFCSIFIGNDSGPKHLASLRGAPVVSLHMSRSNWNEWGQENGGYILSRKLPCAGCLISQNPEECGRDFVCIRNIKPEEVMQAVHKLL